MKQVLMMMTLVFAVTANATTYDANGGAQKITLIIPSWAGTSISFRATRNPTSCASVYYRLQKDYEGYKENYANMILAQTSGSNATIVTYGCDSTGAAIVKSIYLYN